MNIPQAIMYLFPQANPLVDFIVQDDNDDKGPYIAVWNLEDPQPTEEELQAAWEELIALPTPEPEPSELDILGMQLVEKDLQILELQSTVDMLGADGVTKDLQILDLQSVNDFLGQQVVMNDLRITALENPTTTEGGV